MGEVPFERVPAFYGVPLPEIRRIGSEIRMACFLNCGRQAETGDRALAVQVDHPAKLWRCHHKGCGRGGNLVSLCDYLKPGQHSDGRPRGERFKAIIADLLTMKAGETGQQHEAESPEESSAPPAREQPKRRGNVPLAESQNERARGLTTLDEKFLVDTAHMTPKAAGYFRRRPFLTPEQCRKWRMGYLPRDTGGDHAGGTMRGKIVYPMLSEDGQVLTWFGRDPEYEAKLQEWTAGGKEGKEPEKFHFVKDFQRGLELFGQNRFGEEVFREKARETGLVVVQGPNDVMALDALNVPAVGICSMSLTAAQVEKLAAAARSMKTTLTLMFDCDEAGELAMRQALVALAEHCPVRFGWSQAMHGGAFKGREPKSLTAEEWGRIAEHLRG